MTTTPTDPTTDDLTAARQATDEWFAEWWPAAGVRPRRALYALLTSGPLADRLTALARVEALTVGRIHPHIHVDELLSAIRDDR